MINKKIIVSKNLSSLLFKNTNFFAQLSLDKRNTPIAIGDYAILNRKFTPEDVLNFSRISGDDNPIHIDEEIAKLSRFKQRIAHGMLVGSLFSTLCAKAFRGCIYMTQTYKFTAPVFLNENVEAKVEIQEILKERRQIILKTTVTKTETNTIAISGEARILYEEM